MDSQASKRTDQSDPAFEGYVFCSRVFRFASRETNRIAAKKQSETETCSLRRQPPLIAPSRFGISRDVSPRVSHVVAGASERRLYSQAKKPGQPSKRTGINLKGAKRLFFVANFKARGKLLSLTHSRAFELRFIRQVISSRIDVRTQIISSANYKYATNSNFDFFEFISRLFELS